MKNPFLENFRPYIPDKATLRELTPVPLIVGTLLGIIFGASSLYLVLKTGLTVSASIPVAVIAITLFRLLSKIGMRDATILEANMMQTAGSAGESIAFGLGVTMPAIMILGFDLDLTRVMLVAVMGGLLGILMMIPLRRALIKEQHGYLKYPEGTACAEVLKAGASKESREASHEGNTAETDDAALQGGKIISIGFVFGFLFNVLMQVFSFWKGTPEKQFSDTTFKGGSVSLANDPTLLGVGYIIGPKIAGLMMGGGILSYLVLIPMIKFFGGMMTEPVAPAIGKTIAEMDPDGVRGAYVLYIGAGAVAMAGIISLARSLPTIIHGLKGGLADLRGSKESKSNLPRTDQDLSMKWVVGGVILLLLGIMLMPKLGLSVFTSPIVSIFGAILIIILGFLFVTVSSRLTGEVGSSSNPISGMTVATLLITSMIFFALGWVTPPYKVAALSIAAVACIAISNGGTTSQDLKTGYLIGATPSRQQIAILVGSLASAMVLGFVILKLNDAGTVFAARSYPGVRFSQSDYTGEKERLRGPDADRDHAAYNVVWLREPRGPVPTGKYLVDDSGFIKYLEDPGINGKLDTRDNGEKVKSKFSAPKPVLMSFIIEGIMTQRLPWGLVLIGVFVSIVLELCGMSSLAFAVGVYLPLSTSTPIMVGGIVRYIADRTAKRRVSGAEAESGPGVLFASGLIAGASVIGTVLAFLQLSEPTRNFLNAISVGGRIGGFATSDLASLLLFFALGAVLWAVATERWLAPKQA